ncbi:hypothetical protein LITTLEDOG_52 [Serratia phage vB_SmaS_LittleDog]|uniref:Uncharacterized protein n=2 Tax=Bonzeevirus TaxID=3152507 RepID=A0A7T3TL64_9CAUD|nr:hypothetical protein QJS26_gp50 [Serratia phage vB_SmaS_Stoker]YP_010774368.1 hypothetical protein QJS28_gp55 [Serratia phage vB_SmaS_Bigdog]QPX75389.1 hypothetical protein [Serratia phage vB_SmaS_Opt-148]UGO51794.1 hypothetical protein SWAIN_52 [Serratia phage vB_SmaS_Swain]UGO51858.1 hypothetical protein CARROT_52 [Serratia phage vB_SmaS_Carrot]UGO53076.1 hypothetical protein LITTLEDOG_52 [Serratia phage vB_SmaS_LittleDog]QPX75159.1 hypothetical protein BIGDOG_55 [Serratia phage vB_SmaS_
MYQQLNFLLKKGCFWGKSRIEKQDLMGKARGQWWNIQKKAHFKK